MPKKLKTHAASFKFKVVLESFTTDNVRSRSKALFWKSHCISADKQAHQFGFNISNWVVKLICGGGSGRLQLAYVRTDGNGAASGISSIANHYEHGFCRRTFYLEALA